MRILSIDAWGTEDGWNWNNWFTVGSITKEELEQLNTNRKLLAYMREEGYPTTRSVGKVSIEDDQYNIVFCARSDNRPLFAIEYGPEV